MIDLLGPALAFALATSSVTPVAAPEAPAASSSESAPDTEDPSLLERSLVEQDFIPSVEVISSKKLELKIGGFLQLQGAALTGEDSLISNGDVANRPGFRIRRASVGVIGNFSKKLGVLLGINLTQADEDIGTIGDAKLSYDFRDWLGVTVGTGKVAFSRGALLSSRTLMSVERPLTIGAISPSRRLGVTAEGQLFEGKVAYLASLMNGTEGFNAGNRFGGFLYGARAEVSPLGRVRYGAHDATGISLGASGFLEDNPAARRQAVSADVLAAFRGASLLLEGLCDQSAPVEASLGEGPLAAARIERCGAYAEAGYAFRAFDLPLQLVARSELFDDNRRLEDAGDALIFSGGVNVSFFDDYARAQLHYVARQERFGLPRDNDGLVLSMQGTF